MKHKRVCVSVCVCNTLITLVGKNVTFTPRQLKPDIKRQKQEMGLMKTTKNKSGVHHVKIKEYV